MTDFGRLLAALVNGGVEFIVIGGMAAMAHGSAHVTVDPVMAQASVRYLVGLTSQGVLAQARRCHG